MGRDFDKQCNDYINEILADVQEEVFARARYRAQVDFNTEMIDEIADRTGHKNLANTCFVVVDESSKQKLKLDFYTDDSVIDGLYKSNSSFHKGGSKWKSITEHYRMSKYDFWESKFNGEDSEDYGSVDTDWITDNFWKGIYHATNGWPNSPYDDFLHVYTYRDLSAEQVCNEYTDRYIAQNRFGYYVQEEINLMSK